MVAIQFTLLEENEEIFLMDVVKGVFRGACNSTHTTYACLFIYVPTQISPVDRNKCNRFKVNISENLTILLLQITKLYKENLIY